MMKDFSIRDLEKQCIMLKKEVISMIHTAKSGHPGGSLSAAGRSQESQMGRQRPLRSFQRPCVPHPVRGARRTRLL